MKITDFIRDALLFLVTGSILLGWLEYFKVYELLNPLFSPVIHYILGLPEVLGSTLVFGFLPQRADNCDGNTSTGCGYVVGVAGSVTVEQVVVFIVFVTFYFPCFTTFVVIFKEFGKRQLFYRQLQVFLLQRFRLDFQGAVPLVQ
jgi:ferrous iron transport protein B